MVENPKHIFVVDDDVSYAEHVREAFLQHDDKTRVEVFCTLAEVRQRLEEMLPDLFIVDYVLPDGKGTELLPGDGSSPAVPLIFLTDEGDEILAVEVLKAGALDYIVKSDCVFRELPRIADRNLQRWQEICEKRELEKELRLTREAVNAAANAIIITDAEGAITWVNPAFASLTGYSAQEAVGRTPRVLKSGKQPPAFYEEMWATIKAGQVWHSELVNKRKDGSLFTEEMTITPVQDASGEIAHFIAVMQDVTERKSSEAELRKMNQQLEEALENLKEAQAQIVQEERLHALGTMASGIAHDFNNALTPMLGFSELFLTQPALLENRERALEFIRSIHTSALDASAIVNRMREFYRQREEADVLQAMDLNNVVRQAISMTQPKWKEESAAGGKFIEVQPELGDLPAFQGNEAEIRQALINLIINAVDAMPKGGKIVLRTRAAPQVGKAGPAAVIEVCDGGVGMSREVSQRCLEPFFSTKGHSGTGLGLAMVLGTVKRHHGKIAIESAPGKGTTVRLVLPIEHSRQKRISTQEMLAIQRPLRVLLADDEEAVIRLVSIFLEEDDHIITAAPDGAEALRIFNSEDFDLLIIDRAMPKMNGDQVALAAKQRDPDIPIIMLTGFGTMMKESGEVPKGVDAVLGKPVKLKELRSTIARLMKSKPPESA